MTANTETSMIARTGCCAIHSETCLANPGCRVWNSKSGPGLEALVWLGFVTQQFFRFSVMDFSFCRVNVKNKSSMVFNQ